MAAFVQTISTLAGWLQFDRFHDSELHVSGATTSARLSIFSAPQLRQVFVQPNEHIRELYIYKTAIEYLPRGLRNMANLEILQVCAGKLSQFNLGSLSSSQRFSLVDLSSNRVASLVGIGNTVNIGMLELSGNELSVVDMAFFRQIENLTYLNLEANRIARIECSQPVSFASLAQLSMAENQLSSFQTPGMEFPVLVDLLLAGNNLTSIPRNLAKYPALQRLDLNRNKIVLADLASIRLARNMDSLWLGENRITSIICSSPVSHDRLKIILLNKNQLERLNFSGCNFPNMTTLAVRSNKFTVVPSNVFQLLPGVRINLEGHQFPCADLLSYSKELKDRKIIVNSVWGSAPCPTKGGFFIGSQEKACCVE
ncbi:leucine-rich repeat and death domain-containing protein 1-like [Anopheles ziemanni]|uniref:leucine-rich repeat and death domain-containing protein 1-like n=1 Tax=Anopheles coustani TaxID=139045 RepID=UPI002657BBCD|nr:leucine-rich repeat and death domain-containing protein 1-like [Anopheles coustani]XP_058178115.1 leucine-rich repeat and death domain-containing protein 1-like [Anopheles ziemanni]